MYIPFYPRDCINVYAKIGDTSGLDSALSVHEEEVSRLQTDVDTVLSISKKTVAGNSPSHSLIITKKDDEITRKIGDGLYEALQTAMPWYVSKRVYLYKTEKLTIKHGEAETIIKDSGIKFHVEVYNTSNGEEAEWCKILIPVDPLYDTLKKYNLKPKELRVLTKLSRLPLKLSAVVVEDGEEDEKKTELIKAINEIVFARRK